LRISGEDKEIIATAEMPGLEKQDIKINVTEDMLEVYLQGKTKRELLSFNLPPLAG
jgi:HSP20 family molecular chaperone IbpA